MTLQTQTPGGEAQPIPVREAVAAVQAAIRACNKATPGPWQVGSLPPAGWRYICDDNGETLAAVAEWGENGNLHLEFLNAKANAAAIVAARAGYAATLEYLIAVLNPYLGSWRASHDICEQDGVLYRAVAPIVAWHRTQGERG